MTRFLFLAVSLLLAAAAWAPSASAADLTTTTATAFARTAIDERISNVSKVKLTCSVAGTDLATCRTSWRSSGRRYAGVVTLASSSSVVSYTITAVGKARGRKNKLVRSRGNLFVATPVPAPPTTSPAPAPGMTRENPLPLGATATLRSGWHLTALMTTPDATALVMAENMFNDPPASGNQFFIATVRANYTGPGSSRYDGSYQLRAVGASAVEYSTFDNRCGVIPNDMPSSEVFTGGTIEGNVCWQIRSSDATSLVMYDSPGFGGGTRTWMSLVG